MRKRRKSNSLGKYVIFCLFFLTVYTIASLIILVQTGLEAATLTTCVFSTLGGEVLSCALIKIFKLKKEGKENASG